MTTLPNGEDLMVQLITRWQPQIPHREQYSSHRRTVKWDPSIELSFFGCFRFKGLSDMPTSEGARRVILLLLDVIGNVMRMVEIKKWTRGVDWTWKMCSHFWDTSNRLSGWIGGGLRDVSFWFMHIQFDFSTCTCSGRRDFKWFDSKCEPYDKQTFSQC